MSNLNLSSITHLVVPEAHPEKGVVYPGPLPMPIEMMGIARGLVSGARNISGSDFTIDFQGLVFRGYRLPTLHGNHYSFRRMQKVRSLHECGIRPPISNLLVDPRLSMGGLIIVSGGQGNGKSTTCAAVVVDRLRAHGGVCVTIEDPVEIELQGSHGSGICLQRQLSERDTFASAIRGSLRAYPPESSTMMMIGEVRDADTAALALRAATDGRLIVLSMHASGVIASLLRILSLASESMSMSEARALLGNAFRCVLHQKLVMGQLKISTLFDTEAVASKLLVEKTALEMLRTDVDLQNNQMSKGIPLELRN